MTLCWNASLTNAATATAAYTAKTKCGIMPGAFIELSCRHNLSQRKMFDTLFRDNLRAPEPWYKYS